MNVWVRLMRLDKPIGIYLLWAPTAWALWLAGKGHPPLLTVLYFALGTIIMRSAGCIINDIADKDIDKHVQRTKFRPLTTEEISMGKAKLCVGVLLILALLIVLQLPFLCMGYAVVALIVTWIYPRTKRFFKAPQLFLGLAFSMGIPMAYVALGMEFDYTFWALCVLNFCWIIAYDTVYALMDMPDDKLLGVESTARFFGDYAQLMIYGLLFGVQIMWLLIGQLNYASSNFYWMIAFSSLLLGYQGYLIRKSSYLKAFNLNAYYGLMMWGGCWWLCI